MRLAGCLKKGTNDRRTKNSRYYKYEVTKPQPNVIERVIPPSTRQHTCSKWIGRLQCVPCNTKSATVEGRGRKSKEGFGRAYLVGNIIIR